MDKIYVNKSNINEGDEFYLSEESMERFDLLYGNKVKCTGIHKTEDIIHFEAPTIVGGTLHSGVFINEKPYKLN